MCIEFETEDEAKAFCEGVGKNPVTFAERIIGGLT